MEKEKKIVGYICYHDSWEEVAYYDEDEMLKDFKQDIYYRGITAQNIIGVADENLNLRYRIHSLVRDEYGYDSITFDEYKECLKTGNW